MAVNGYDESKEEVQAFATKAGLKHPILLLGGKTGADLYGVEGFPSSFWIDPEGRIVGKERGFDPTHVPTMEKRIEKYLRERERELKK